MYLYKKNYGVRLAYMRDKIYVNNKFATNTKYNNKRGL